AGASAEWIGTWRLNVEESTFETPLVPGIPAGFKLVSQTLRIEQLEREIRISGDSVYSDNTGQHSSHEDNRLSLDGKPTAMGPISLSYRPIDGSSFEIVSQLNLPGRSLPARTLKEVSHFAVSSDGGTLTETKVQTDDTQTSVGTKSSTSVLVFRKVTEK